MKSLIRNNSLTLVAVLGAVSSVLAQGSWPNCPDVTNADFKATTLVSRSADLIEEPMKMAFENTAAAGTDAKDKVHVYFTERKGKLRKYDAVQKKTLTIGTITGMTIGGTSSDGLIGIALDPNFKSNHQLFLYYTHGNGASAKWRVSRWNLNAAHDQLEAGSEKVILDIPITIGSQHPGGTLVFDAHGDLWISTGDNHLPGGANYYIHTSANTNDLRGKILRIKPKADGSGYDIPDGNLFPKGTAKTRPEIYIMGGRNPYSLALDPVRRWLAWGEVGPDNTNMDGQPMNQAGSSDMTEEYNLAKAPGNYGYPYFAGKNFALKSGINAAAPTIPANIDWKGAQEGLLTLPAAVPAIKAYRKNCAITGPIYRYNGDLNSSIKFPPHFNRKWFTTDFNTNTINLYTLNAEGTAISTENTVLTNIRPDRPLDMQMGPDGALYVSNYAGYRTVTAGTSIIRIEYTGSCRPLEPKEETVSALARSASRNDGPRLEILQGKVLSLDVAAAGEFKVEVRDFLGRPVASRQGRGQTRLTLGEVREPGVYLVRVSSAQGVTSRTMVRQ